MLPNENLKKTKLNKNGIVALKEIANQYNIHLETKIKKKDIINHILSHLQQKMFEPIKNTNTNKFNLITLGINIKNKFEELFDSYKIDYVIIENQISPIANRMKCIQAMITQYFIMKNCINIEYISSSNKLKNFTDKKLNYNERKKLGIITTFIILEKNALLNGWCDFFTSHKKKDDLADSFLQALWFVEHNKFLNN